MTSAKQRILEAAAGLFYERGIAAAGIDAITSVAGVAKKSLYNHFSSKDDLIQAYLRQRDAEWRELYQARVVQARDPGERVLAVFDAYIDHASTAYAHGFRGCGLLNAAAELPVGSSGREIVREHKQHVETLLSGHLTDLLPDESEALRLAEHLSFLLEGAMSRAGLEGDHARLWAARRLASGLLARV